MSKELVNSANESSNIFKGKFKLAVNAVLSRQSYYTTPLKITIQESKLNRSHQKNGHQLL